MRGIAGGMEQRRLAVAQITGELGNRRQQPRAPWQAAPCLQNVDRNIAVQQGADRSRIPKHHHFDLKPGPLQAVGQVARDPFDASFAEMIEQDRDVWTFHQTALSDVWKMDLLRRSRDRPRNRGRVEGAYSNTHASSPSRRTTPVRARIVLP